MSEYVSETDRIKDIVFEEPPEPRTPRYDWQAIREQLMKNPGQWARVFEKDRASVVVAIRSGHIGPMHPERGIETRTANNVREPVRTCSLYARYIPEKDKESDQ